MAQKRRKSTAGTPVPTTRNGKEPVYRHNLQENSQARFCQLDTTVARRNRPAKRRRGLRQALRGRGKRRSAQARRIHHAKESLEEARIDRKEFRSMYKASRVQEFPQLATPEGGEDRRPPIPARDPSAAAEDSSRQPEGQRGSGHPQKRAGTS